MFWHRFKLLISWTSIVMKFNEYTDVLWNQDFRRHRIFQLFAPKFRYIFLQSRTVNTENFLVQRIDCKMPIESSTERAGLTTLASNRSEVHITRFHSSLNLDSKKVIYIDSLMFRESDINNSVYEKSYSSAPNIKFRKSPTKWLVRLVIKFMSRHVPIKGVHLERDAYSTVSVNFFDDLICVKSSEYSRRCSREKQLNSFLPKYLSQIFRTYLCRLLLFSS